MTCEKCWGDAYGRMRALGGSQSDHYHDLLHECEFNPCTPDEAAGVVHCPHCSVVYTSGDLHMCADDQESGTHEL